MTIRPAVAETYLSGSPLDYMFHPSAIAVVGASRDPENRGYQYLKCLKEIGFKGALYPVNPGVEEILGLKAYPSILDVPGAVDYVISCIPARLALKLVQECAEKGVKTIQFYTARFGETGLEERAVLEKELIRIGRASGIKIIGPNCIGIYYPAGGLSFQVGLTKEGGTVGFLSQSGGHSISLVVKGARRGLRFSKAISYGNAADLNESDFLGYFLQDPETKIIAAYIEGVKDGRGFFQRLREAHKPVVIMKGGGTSAGRRAVASHTASLSGEGPIWGAIMKQTGAVSVDGMDEMVDALLTFQHFAPPLGKRVAVMGGAGGESVGAADICEKAGLVVPPIPPEVREEMKEWAPDMWSLTGNPLDTSAVRGPESFNKAAELLASHPVIDLVIGSTGLDLGLRGPDRMAPFLGNIRNLIKIGKTAGKPVAMVIRSPDFPEKWEQEALQEGQRVCAAAQVPLYSSMERASRAISRVVGYYLWREKA